MSVSIKERYRVARALIRANGRYAMRWVAPDLREAMNHVLDSQHSLDLLAMRQKFQRQKFPDVEHRRECFMLTSPMLFRQQAW